MHDEPDGTICTPGAPLFARAKLGIGLALAGFRADPSKSLTTSIAPHHPTS
jgi:hypothetical protein